MNYQETGNKIPVDEEELINAMILKYDAYARSQNTDAPLPNPDKEPIIYTTKDGRTIKIPDEIKIKAKTIWLKDLIHKVQNKQVKMEDVGIKPQTQVIRIYDDNQKLTNLVILILAVIIAAYLLYTYGGQFSTMYNTSTEQLKFYLGN